MTAELIPRQLATTIVVAASDSLEPERASWSDSLGRYLQCDGVNDHVEIQAALDALPATGGEVFLLDGTYNVEVALVLDSYQTLRGCGRNTVLTTSTADVVFLSAVGGAGTELTGIVIADLQIDGGAGHLGTHGIYFNYVDYSFIFNVYSRRNRYTAPSGIYLLDCDFNIITNNTCEDNNLGIHLETSTNNIVSGNICQGNNNYGIGLTAGSNNNAIIGNVSQGNADGIALSNSHNNTITGNVCLESIADGIYVSDSNNNTISNNTCRGNRFTGMFISGNNNTIVGNTLTENSQATTNTYDDIYLINADYNNIQANTCRAGALVPKPRYGINISNAACDGNLVTNNDLRNDGFGTGSFNDAGTGTRLNTYKVPFADGTDPQDSGFLIDAAAEMARAWLRLPGKVAQVVRMKVYARSVVLEADKMRAEFVVNGGADNEPYNTHVGSVANHPSTSANFAADDVIYWTIITAGVLALLGGDSVEVKVLHEDAGNGDCATNAYLRTVEIEYV